MNGITILNTIVIDEPAKWVLPTALSLGFVCICTFLLMLNTDGGIGTICLGSASTLALISALIIVLASQSHWRANERNQYECIIDDSVSINEVYENYNIIERRGDIWVLEEKTNE